MEDKQVQHSPTIIMPSRDFLIGSLYGFNAGRRLVSKDKDIKPIVNNRDITKEDFYLGYWLEFECNKCNRHYGYDNPNHIPLTDMVCETEGCGNIVVAYGVGDPKQWQIGKIKLI